MFGYLTDVINPYCDTRRVEAKASLSFKQHPLLAASYNPLCEQASIHNKRSGVIFIFSTVCKNWDIHTSYIELMQARMKLVQW